MSDEATMLFNMSFTEAKRLRQRFGDAKYGTGLRDTKFLGEAYIEAVDIDNYIDIAQHVGQIRPGDAAVLRDALSQFIVELRGAYRNGEPR